MVALVKVREGEGGLELRDIPDPVVGPGEVKIRVAATGICGSDLHVRRGDMPLPMRLPVAIGHEFSGVVAETGDGVTTCRPGDRVTSETTFASCGQCTYCRAGSYNLCADRRTIGYWHDGAFAAYTKVPQARIHHLPQGMDFTAGAMMEPLACVTHAVLELVTIRSTDVVLVSGPGAIGLLATQVAASQGAIVIVAGVGEKDRARLELASELGAGRTVDASTGNVVDVVRGLTSGLGADVVVECSGAAAAVEAGLDAVRKQGQFVQVGQFGRPIGVSFDRIGYRELKVTGSLGSRWSSWQLALRLAGSGRVRTGPLATHVLPLARWEEGFGLAEEQKAVKVILRPE